MTKFGPLLATVLFAWVAVARAEPADAAAARALLDDGRRLMAAGQPYLACPKLEESDRLDPDGDTSVEVADCWERVGRTASAWARYLEIAAAALAAGQSEREQLARSRAAALEPSLARLRIDVTDPPVGLEVRRDGAVIGQAQWSAPVPVDPGRHEVRATAPGRTPWAGVAEVGRSGAIVSLAIPPLQASEPAAPPPPADTLPSTAWAFGPPAASGQAPAAREGTPRRAWQLPVGIAFLAAGGLTAALGGYFGTIASSKNDDAKKICPTSFACSDAEIRHHEVLLEEAGSARTTAIASVAVGGTLMVVGVVLVAVAPGSEERAAAPQIAVLHDGRGPTLRLSGSF